MDKRMLAFSFTLLICFACTSVNTADVSQSPASSSLPIKIPADTMVVLERTICHGTCPAYKLTISADGKVIFEGKEFVKTKGKAFNSITQEQLRQLISEVEKAEFFSLNDQYLSEKDGCKATWTDHPSAITTVILNGKTKKINHDHGCRDETPERSYGNVYPKQLLDLENKIDEIVGTKRWLESR